MNIQDALRGVGRSCADYCYNSQQAAMAVATQLKVFRNDPELFQKTCQIANYCLQLAILHNPALNSLSRFSFALQTANMHDFYSFLKQPRQWFCPVSARAIDEHAVLESMTDVLYSQVHPDILTDDEIINESDDEDIDRASKKNEADVLEEKEDLRKVARLCLQEQLEQMDKSDDAYRSVDDFRKVLEKRLTSAQFKVRMQNFNVKHPNDFKTFNLDDLKDIKLEDVEVPLRHTPLLERMTNYTWTVVDIGCVGLYMQGWKLLDTAKWANRIGSYQAFQWVKSQHLDQWVVGLVCAGFAWKFLEAVRKLQDDALTAQERSQAKWDRITSVAEIVLWGSVLLNLMDKTRIDNTYIYCFGIFAKSLGAISIAARSKHKFFAPAT